MKWEQFFRPISREVTWRVANINVDRDPTTGHREPDYSLTHEIYVVFEEIGGSLTPLPSGYVQRGDAVMRCFDNVVPLDQIYKPEDQRYYQVEYVRAIYEIVQAGDDQITNFCYRICDLNYLEFYKEV